MSHVDTSLQPALKLDLSSGAKGMASNLANADSTAHMRNQTYAIE